MGRWYLVRHGETSWNREGRIQGHADVALSEPGRRQMQRIAARLAGYDFAAIYCSDLARAKDSALAIVDGRGVSVETDSDLREFSYGEWEGLTIGEVESRGEGISLSGSTRGIRTLLLPVARTLLPWSSVYGGSMLGR